jgi:hypothetical protein
MLNSHARILASLVRKNNHTGRAATTVTRADDHSGKLSGLPLSNSSSPKFPELIPENDSEDLFRLPQVSEAPQAPTAVFNGKTYDEHMDLLQTERSLSMVIGSMEGAWVLADESQRSETLKVMLHALDKSAGIMTAAEQKHFSEFFMQRLIFSFNHEELKIVMELISQSPGSARFCFFELNEDQWYTMVQNSLQGLSTDSAKLAINGFYRQIDEMLQSIHDWQSPYVFKIFRGVFRSNPEKPTDADYEATRPLAKAILEKWDDSIDFLSKQDPSSKSDTSISIDDIYVQAADWLANSEDFQQRFLRRLRVGPETQFNGDSIENILTIAKKIPKTDDLVSRMTAIGPKLVTLRLRRQDFIQSLVDFLDSGNQKAVEQIMFAVGRRQPFELKFVDGSLTVEIKE